MKLPSHKTKIICTIGPATRSPQTLEELIKAGMSVARLNFSHGTLESKREEIRAVFAASEKAGRPVTILLDLPGTKIRVGQLKTEPLILKKDDVITLTVSDSPSSPDFIPVEYKQLTESVAAGGKIYLNDGFIELRVEEVSSTEVACTVVVGGPLLSHKGLNLPGAKTMVDPVTDRDLELVEFGLNEGVDMFGISFVEKAEDIFKVREFARKKGKTIRAIAKIERAEAVHNFDEILNASDGIMIARGDLGVEMPIEEVPVIQKSLISKANLWGRPVITATQMLESMKANTRPTRAEVSDVANAILDGTDAIMLSEETAIGRYPVETVKMMASIAAFTERQRTAMGSSCDQRSYLKSLASHGKLTIPDVISRNVVEATEALKIRYILTPTDTGNTPRRVSRFKPDCWILSFSKDESACRFLCLSYGVYPFQLAKEKSTWHEVIMEHIRRCNLIKENDRVIITEGRFIDKPGGTDSLEIINV